MTNYLYLCSLPDDAITLENEPRKVLMRIYGEIVDLKQRFYESIIFTVLSERNIGPKTYGVFYSGRIEEFYPVCKFDFNTKNLVHVKRGILKIKEFTFRLIFLKIFIYHFGHSIETV